MFPHYISIEFVTYKLGDSFLLAYDMCDIFFSSSQEKKNP